jgi:imidazolonepropionase-like amidohydrolase
MTASSTMGNQMRGALWAAFVLVLSTACAGSAPRSFVSIDAPIVAITRVRVIDGTGVPGKADQTVVIQNGQIQDVGGAATVAVPPAARVVDGHGR